MPRLRASRLAAHDSFEVLDVRSEGDRWEHGMSAAQEAEMGDWETPCPKRADGKHCAHWYDGEPCCACEPESVIRELRERAEHAERALADYKAEHENQLTLAEREIYVPGHWRCPQCGFVNVLAVLNALTGEIGVGNPADICPNDGALMQRVKWSEIAKGVGEQAEQRVRALEVAIRNLLAELSSVQIEAVREGAGNTNAACLQRRRDELAALTAPPAEEPK